MKKISVPIPGKCHNVYLGKNIFKDLNGFIKKENLYKNIFVVADKNMFNANSKTVLKFYDSVIGKKYLYVYDNSESNKSFAEIQKILAEMLANKFGRDTLIVAIGGGITGDIAGFAASVFARGVQFVQVPTTLLAMVDSSVGGKTGINFEHVKNIIGSFYQPRLVLSDTNFLNTLPDKEIICGIGEILKYGLLIGDDFFNKLKKYSNKLLLPGQNFITSVIEECVRFKSNIVKNDEKEESGLRKILNLGHTFAHAFEVEQKHKIKHGQAVIAGIACALHLSNKLNLLNDNLLAEYLSLVIKFADKIKIKNPDVDLCYEIMSRDKKNKDDEINFVLVAGARKILVDVKAGKDDVYYALKKGLQYFIY